DVGGGGGCSTEGKAVLFKKGGDALEQLVVAAAKHTEDARQEPQRLEIEPDLPDCRPHHRADENDIAAAFAARQAAKRAELTDRRPVMPIGRNPRCIRPAANCKKHDPASVLCHRIGNCKRQGSAAANNCQRAVICRFGRHCVGHASSTVAARRMAMVSGREPERMNARTLATSGSAPFSAAT